MGNVVGKIDKFRKSFRKNPIVLFGMGLNDALIDAIGVDSLGETNGKKEKKKK